GQLWCGPEIAPASTPPITTPRTAESQIAQTTPAASKACCATEAAIRPRMASRAGSSPTAGTRCATGARIAPKPATPSQVTVCCKERHGPDGQSRGRKASTQAETALVTDCYLRLRGPT